MRKTCSVLTCEYLDLDVYLNVRLFYESAGYRVYKNKPLRNADLLVVLRGDKTITDKEYTGIVHAYDYVREYKINWRERFPKAERIFVISLTPPDFQEDVIYIKAYLPVVPELWQRPFKKKDNRPIYISHFKPMAEDRYQQELIGLIKSGAVRVFGAKWEKAGIKTRLLSYWQVWRKFCASSRCYGLMYPYQRGRTLSGRMWQAPLCGCFVISEAGTNINNCPGVIEAGSFSEDNIAAIDGSMEKCETLAAEAERYWTAATHKLAEELELSGAPDKPVSGSIRAARRELFLRHINPRRLLAGIRGKTA